MGKLPCELAAVSSQRSALLGHLGKGLPAPAEAGEGPSALPGDDGAATAADTADTADTVQAAVALGAADGERREADKLFFLRAGPRRWARRPGTGNRGDGRPAAVWLESLESACPLGAPGPPPRPPQLREEQLVVMESFRCLTEFQN